MATTLTKLPDPGALSGPLTGISFIAGVGGGVAIANSPYPGQRAAAGPPPAAPLTGPDPAEPGSDAGPD
jgi:hypothetical protein